MSPFQQIDRSVIPEFKKYVAELVRITAYTGGSSRESIVASPAVPDTCSKIRIENFGIWRGSKNGQKGLSSAKRIIERRFYLVCKSIIREDILIRFHSKSREVARTNIYFIDLSAFQLITLAVHSTDVVDNCHIFFLKSC